MYMERASAKGRTAVVTGGARGIGFATVQALCEAGATVGVTGPDEGRLAGARLAKEGHPAHFAVLDVTDSAACDAVSAELNARFGAVDIVVANAGIAWKDTAAEAVEDDVWRKVLDVNLNGTYWTCRAFGKPMLDRGEGAVVIVGSMSGLISNNPQKQVAYNASKAGIHHLARSLAGEWATRGVRVNAVAPGYVDTDMSNVTVQDPYYGDRWMEGTPMRRMLRPEEVASVNLFLATEASSGMTGSVVVVDGGYTIW